MSIKNALSKLKSNLFGGPGNTGFSQPPPSKVQDIGMTPTGSLDIDPLRFGTYQFPKDVFENGQLGHYMMFYVSVQDRTKYDYGNRKTSEYSENIVDEFATTDKYGTAVANARLKVKRQKKTGSSVSRNNSKLDLSDSTRNSSSLQGLSKFRKTTTRISDSIALYLPANVTDTTTARYEDSPTGALGVAMNDFLRLSNSLSVKDYETMGTIGGKVISDFSKEALKRFAGATAEALSGSEGAIPLANRIFGQADNPFVQVFFTDMGVRVFTYNFVFAPRNPAETMEVQQIIQLFRFHMTPELQGTNSRYLTLPSEFDIHYMFKAEDGAGYENDYYNRIGTCVLENVSTNYTPNGVKSFSDGAPTAIKMDLTFREIETLTKEKINEGY